MSSEEKAAEREVASWMREEAVKLRGWATELCGEEVTKEMREGLAEELRALAAKLEE